MSASEVIFRERFDFLGAVVYQKFKYRTFEANNTDL